MTSKRFLLRITVVLVLATIAGRILGILYGEASTNIIYADWIGMVLGYAEDLLGCLRTTYLICAVVYGFWMFGLSFSNKLICICSGLILFDMTTRLVLDLLTNSITDLVTVAVIWLALQYAYELILCILAWITAQLLHHLGTTGTHTHAVRYTLSAALRISLLWQLLARVGMEVYNILSFTGTYTNITGAEISSMAGYFLYAVILYGGVAFLLEEGLHVLWDKRFTKAGA